MKCPYCAEEVQSEAKKCKHCGEWLTKSAALPNRLQIANTAKREKNKAEAGGCLYTIVTVVSFLVAVLFGVHSDSFVAGLIAGGIAFAIGVAVVANWLKKVS